MLTNKLTIEKVDNGWIVTSSMMGDSFTKVYEQFMEALQFIATTLKDNKQFQVGDRLQQYPARALPNED
jgi:hypothetical protein